MPHHPVVIDAATRFLRSNPELLDFARRGAGETGQRVEDLLTDAVSRIRRSGFEAVTEEQVIVGPPYRLDRRAPQRGRGGHPPIDHPRPWVVAISPGDQRGNGQEELVHRVIREQAAEQ
jgi:hypothetical protein